MSFGKPVLEFIVVQPVPRTVIKKFKDFNQARTFASTASPSARVEEHQTNDETCSLCGADK
jgi:hypothetical protein